MTAKNRRLDKAIGAIKINRIILPIILGIGVVSYLLYTQFDANAFKKIDWSLWTFSWIGLGILFYVFRHLSYSFRLKVLSDGAFSWKKCIELIFIWEFASAVSPTNLGGSAVALVLLAQERIKAAKSVAIVLYSVVLDTSFFIVTLPLLYLFMGPSVIRPGLKSMNDIDGYGITFLVVFGFMFVYGFIFFYGLFIRPKAIRRFLRFLASLRPLKRFRKSLLQTAQDVIITSKELKKKNFIYHLKAILSTYIAWFFKFGLIVCLIYGVIKGLEINLENTMFLYGRYETMFAITAFSPTPGGSGVAEFLFGGFYSDYVPESLAIVIALMWRLIAYYSYLFMGVIIVPDWIRRVLKKRKLARSKKLK